MKFQLNSLTISLCVRARHLLVDGIISICVGRYIEDYRAGSNRTRFAIFEPRLPQIALKCCFPCSALFCLNGNFSSSRFVSYFLLTMTRETDTIFLSDYWAAHEHKVKGRMPSGMWQVPCGKWQVVSGTLKCYELNAILAWASVTATQLPHPLATLDKVVLGRQTEIQHNLDFCSEFYMFPLNCFALLQLLCLYCGTENSIRRIL